MKISYKVLKKYIKDIKSPEEIAKDLVMHTAEVEDIVLEWAHLEHVYVWEILSCEKHPESEKLNCTTVKVLWNTYSIVCWAPNVRAWLKVPIAICWAQLAPDFVIQKTKIRWVTSEWMICSEDELWLIKDRQIWILELPEHAELDISMRDFLDKNDAILEIDNKAINHRPDLFSHIWVIREIYAINNKKFEYEYSKRDFSKLPSLNIINKITDVVSRYKWLKIENVKNIASPDYIKQVLFSADITSKWLLIDISNYSLYLYWQPTHCFDADKINGDITIRYAKNWEKFIALNDKEYELSSEDIVIADNNWVLALWWIIWWKNSSVNDTTKNIIIESAHFDQAVVRKTWKRLWVRTDSLNIFEKDITNWIQHAWMSLIVDELEKNLEWIKLISYSDIYPKKQQIVNIPFDLNFINNLIGKKYSIKEALDILNNLWITESNWILTIPFWRKDLTNKADIAEEIARIDWYDNIEPTVPRINLWAIIQTNTYKIKNDVRNFLTSKWYYDMYTYSFVNQELMEKTLWNTKNLVSMKNALSEDLTHLRWSLIPNLLHSLEKNFREYNNLKLFELEKIFLNNNLQVDEVYSLAWVEINEKEIVYYDIQSTISNLFKTLWITNYLFNTCNEIPSFAHCWRTADIIVRWKKIWTIWEIHPKVAKNFDINKRIWFFEININLLQDSVYNLIKANDVSQFQENNFDLNFVVNKDTKAKDIKITIINTDIKLIKKVELIDIYENEEILKWKRSLTFRIYIQSMNETLNDKIKNQLIENIIEKVKKKWWEIR